MKRRCSTSFPRFSHFRTNSEQYNSEQYSIYHDRDTSLVTTSRPLVASLGQRLEESLLHYAQGYFTNTDIPPPYHPFSYLTPLQLDLSVAAYLLCIGTDHDQLKRRRPIVTETRFAFIYQLLNALYDRNGDIVTIISLVGVALCLHQRLLNRSIAETEETSGVLKTESVSLVHSHCDQHISDVLVVDCTEDVECRSYRSDSVSTIASSMGRDDELDNYTRPRSPLSDNSETRISKRSIRFQFDFAMSKSTSDFLWRLLPFLYLAFIQLDDSYDDVVVGWNEHEDEECDQTRDPQLSSRSSSNHQTVHRHSPSDRRSQRATSHPGQFFPKRPRTPVIENHVTKMLLFRLLQPYGPLPLRLFSTCNHHYSSSPILTSHGSVNPHLPSTITTSTLHPWNTSTSDGDFEHDGNSYNVGFPHFDSSDVCGLIADDEFEKEGLAREIQAVAGDFGRRHPQFDNLQKSFQKNVTRILEFLDFSIIVNQTDWETTMDNLVNQCSPMIGMHAKQILQQS